MHCVLFFYVCNQRKLYPIQLKIGYNPSIYEGTLEQRFVSACSLNTLEDV